MRKTSPWLWLACLLLVGCRAAVQDPVSDADPVTPAPGTPDVTTQIKSWTETQELIASHKGKIVVVDAWANW